MSDNATIKINFMGLLLSIIYISIFYFYTPLKQKIAVWGKIGMAGSFTAALIAYTIVTVYTKTVLSIDIQKILIILVRRP